jgi:D-alanine transaminase
VDQSIYLQVTRGQAKRDHRFPEHCRPTVFVMSTPLTAPPPAWLEQGIGAVTVEDVRWQWCYIKSINLLPNILLRQQAVDEGAEEAILIREGWVTEGAASNVFIVRGGKLVTPPQSALLLPGITRDLVVELAGQNGIDCEQAPISAEELHAADEIWLTSSTREILPVTRLDGKPVGSGDPGSLWRRVYDIYQDYKRQLREAV